MDITKLFSDIGMQHYENGEYEKALKYFNDGLEADSESIFLLYNKANCLLTMGESEEAYAIFRQVTEICKKMDKTELILSIYASSLVALKDLDNVEAVLKDLLEINPENLEALINYGQIYNDSCDYDNALKYFDKALEIDGENEFALTFKADVLFSMERYDESKECMDRAFELSKDNAYLWYLKGLYESRVLSHYELAVEYFDNALDLNVDFQKCYFEKLIALILLGKTNEAKETFHKFEDLHPDDYDESMRAISDEIIEMMVSGYGGK